MKNVASARACLPLFCGTALFLAGCDKPPPQVTFAQAPPGPAELGPAAELPEAAAGAVLFDLKYRPQVGDTNEPQYHSFWGFGGTDNRANTSPFIASLPSTSSKRHYVENPFLKGREWAAVEHTRGHALAFYFDVNADGKFSENERLLPARKSTWGGYDFITPDFLQVPDGTRGQDNGGPTLSRLLLQVNFPEGGGEPNCMWSPAAVMEGSAALDGKPMRLLLYANKPGGRFTEFGSSSYSLVAADRVIGPHDYIPREMLSSLICEERRFYRLAVEGVRSNGLPARVSLSRDQSPTGQLTVNLSGSNQVQAALSYAYLKGVDDQSVLFRVATGGEKITLPQGNYAFGSGSFQYGAKEPREWEVFFEGGGSTTVKAGHVAEVAMGNPTLKVRAVEERLRYQAREGEGSSTFKRGTQIYFEPRVTGKAAEVYGRFRQSTGGRGELKDRPPAITIAASDGKQVFSKTMEYG